MIDVVFARVGASSRAEQHWSGMLPLGIGYLAAVTRRTGYTTAVVDGRRSGHASLDETTQAIAHHRPRIVGLSCLTADFPRAVRLAGLLKDVLPNCKILLGGAHVNAMPKESLAEAAAVDYAVAGEAEESIPEIVAALSAGREIGEVPGVFSRDSSGAVRQHAAPTYDVDVSALPFPAWDLFGPATTFPVLSERGCPFSCVFCSRNMSRRVRSRAVEDVAEEVRWLATDRDARAIDFEDETFGLKLDRAFELLARLTELSRRYSLSFKAQTRTDRVTPELANAMGRAGFRYVELGVESGDQAVLDASAKGIRVSQAKSAVRMLHEAGIKTWINFVIGLPGETTDSVKKSISLAARLNPDRLSVAIIVAYPGTDIYRWAVEGRHGYRFLTHDWEHFDKYLSPSLELDGLPYPTMRRLQIRMYAETYLRNFRFGDFGRLVWKSRSFVGPALRSAMGRSRARGVA